jgi:hypothetical protein
MKQQICAEDCLGPANKNEMKEVPQLGFDDIERLPIYSLPAELLGNGFENMSAAATAMTYESSNGPAFRRMVARSLQDERLSLRLLQAASNAAIVRAMQGLADHATLNTLEKMTEGAHRRWLNTSQMFMRLGQAPVPTTRIRVSANAAQLNFGTGAARHEPL